LEARLREGTARSKQARHNSAGDKRQPQQVTSVHPAHVALRH
jgi:hypothetical protein